MSKPVFTIFYVDSIEKGNSFYQQLLQIAPLEASPTFAMFKLNDAAMLGLWTRKTMRPESTVLGGGSELAIVLDSVKDVDDKYQLLQTQPIAGMAFLSECVWMEFGYNFIVTDPDGHRIRFFFPKD